MPETRIRPPRGLLIATVILVLFGLVAGPVTLAIIPEEELPKAILILALPFLSFFIAILLVFIWFIFFVASRLNGSISRRAYLPVEAIIIVGIVLGVVGMFAPDMTFEPLDSSGNPMVSIPIVTTITHHLSFLVLLVSTLAFIVWSHVTPKRERQGEVANRAE